MNNKNLLSLREIQLEELKILEKIAEFLEKNNLRYSLNGGTLLGAIRHKGFIPWDDDIDIAMPRPDYDKFIELYSKQPIDDNLILCCPENKTEFLPFCKIKNKEIEAIDDNSKSEKKQNFLWIDIFPVDGISISEKELKWKYRKMSFYTLLLYVHRNKLYFSKKGYFFKDIIKLILKPISLLVSAKTLIKFAAKMDYEKAKYIGKFVSGYGLKEALLKEDYEEYIKVEFEGRKFSVIKNYDKYLTNIFGDYMTLPPKNERITHHLEAWRVKEKESENNER